jgi:hypothetical protein
MPRPRKNRKIALSDDALSTFSGVSEISEKAEIANKNQEISNDETHSLSEVEPIGNLENQNESDGIDPHHLKAVRDSEIAKHELERDCFVKNIREKLENEVSGYYEWLSDEECNRLVDLEITVSDSRGLYGFGSFVTAGYAKIQRLTEPQIERLTVAKGTYRDSRNALTVRDNGTVGKAVAEDFKALEMLVDAAMESVNQHSREVERKIAVIKAEYQDQAKDIDYLMYLGRAFTRQSNFKEETAYRIDDYALTEMPQITASFPPQKAEVEVFMLRAVDIFLQENPNLL